MAGEFTRGEICMGGIVTMFIEYASKDSDKDHLSKSEVKQLLEKEFPHFITGVDSKQMADQIMATLDANRDEKMDFQEFICLIGTLSMLCKMIIAKCCKEKCPK